MTTWSDDTQNLVAWRGVDRPSLTTTTITYSGSPIGLLLVLTRAEETTTTSNVWNDPTSSESSWSQGSTVSTNWNSDIIETAWRP